MTRSTAGLAALLMAVALSAGAPSPAAGADAPRAQPLARLLRELAGDRLQFVFSSRLVPDSLEVSADPASLRGAGIDTLGALDGLLAPMGLALARVAPGIYAVISRPVAPRVAPLAAPPAAQGQAATEPLSEVVIAASRYRVADATVAIAHVDASELSLEIVPGSDPLRAIAGLPGVVQDGLSARSHVRGGEAGEELLLLDGFPLRSPFHLAAYQSPFSVVDAGLVRSMDVYTGGFPARYGNRMSAVFDVHTFDVDELPKRTLAADFVNASARYAGAPIAGIDTLVDARIGTLGPLLEAFAPTVGRPRYGDAFVSASRAFDNGARVAARLLWSRDELAISDRRRGESADIDGRLRYLWVQASLPLWPGATGEAWLGESIIDSERVGTLATPGIATGSVDDDRHSTLWDARLRLGWEITSRHFLDGGVDFTHERGHYDYFATATYAGDVAQLFDRPVSFTRDERVDPERRRASVYLAHRWQWHPAVTTELGVRGESVVTRGLETRWDVDPRVGLRWQATDDLRLHLNWGRYGQADEIHELMIEDGLNSFPAPQRSEHLILGADFTPDERSAVRAALFSKHQSHPRARFENLFNRRTILPEIGPDRAQFLPVDSEVHGVELSGERRFGPWRIAMNTGWSEALDENAGSGTGGAHTRRSWDVGWEMGLSGSWRYGPWTLSSSLQRRPGFPTTALLRSGPGVALGERNGIRLQRYLEWDARAEYVRATGAGVLQYSAQITNLLNAPNDCCTELLRDGDALALRRLRGLPLLPSLGMRWSW
jgi:outer membrane receptor protein involved in Fe transport